MCVCWTDVWKQHDAFRGLIQVCACVGRVLKKKGQWENTRGKKVEERASQRGKVQDYSSPQSLLIQIRKGGKTALLHNSFFPPWIDCIDRIPYWQRLRTFLTACIRKLSSAECEQQQHKTKGCPSVLSDPTGDFWLLIAVSDGILLSNDTGLLRSDMLICHHISRGWCPAKNVFHPPHYCDKLRSL